MKIRVLDLPVREGTLCGVSNIHQEYEIMGRDAGKVKSRMDLKSIMCND